MRILNLEYNEKYVFRWSLLYLILDALFQACTREQYFVRKNLKRQSYD